MLLLFGALVPFLALGHIVPVLTDSIPVRLTASAIGWLLLMGTFVWGSVRELRYLGRIVKPTRAWRNYVSFRGSVSAAWMAFAAWAFIGRELGMKVGFEEQWLWVIFLLIALSNGAHYLHGRLEARDVFEVELAKVALDTPGEE